MGVLPKAHGERGRAGARVLIAGVAVLLVTAGVGTVVLVRQWTAAEPPGRTLAESSPVLAQALPATSTAPEANPVLRSVTYELTGGAGALNVTYVLQGSAIEQLRQVGTPWSKSFVRRGTGHGTDYVTVSAQNAGNGKLGCRILVDGTVVSERSTAGANGVVNCAKTIN